MEEVNLNFLTIAIRINFAIKLAYSLPVIKQRVKMYSKVYPEGGHRGYVPPPLRV